MNELKTAVGRYQSLLNRAPSPTVSPEQAQQQVDTAIAGVNRVLDVILSDESLDPTLRAKVESLRSEDKASRDLASLRAEVAALRQPQQAQFDLTQVASLIEAQIVEEIADAGLNPDSDFAADIWREGSQLIAADPSGRSVRRFFRQKIAEALTAKSAAPRRQVSKSTPTTPTPARAATDPTDFMNRGNDLEAEMKALRELGVL